MKSDWREHIVSDPRIMFGKPVVKGTRIPVDLILEKLSEGETADHLLSSYPQLKIDDVYSCLAFGSESVTKQIVYEIN